MVFAKRLLELEAFELLAYITDKSTSAQEKRRIEARKKAKEKAQLEMEQFNKLNDDRKVKIYLINQIGLN